jgi:hypothetical protein
VCMFDAQRANDCITCEILSNTPPKSAILHGRRATEVVAPFVRLVSDGDDREGGGLTKANKRKIGLATRRPRMKKRLARDETHELVGGSQRYAAPSLRTSTETCTDIESEWELDGFVDLQGM